MKTKVRIQQSKTGIYTVYQIDLLKSCYDDQDYLTTYGAIRFQKSDTCPELGWHGMNVVCESKRHEDFLLCAKVLQHINTYREMGSEDPEQILAIIGAVEHVLYNGDFIPYSWNGYKMFKVIENNKPDGWYATIFAPTEALAERIRAKKKYDSHRLEFTRVVELERIRKVY